MTTTTARPFDEMNVTDLRGECKSRGISYSGNDRKADLLTKLATVSNPAVVAAASDDRIERMRLAQVEHKAMKAWRKAGAKGTPPSTPNLDAVNAEAATGPRKANGAKKPARRSTSTAATQRAPRAPKAALVFTRDGNPLPDGRGVSYQAWSCTKGIGGDVARISTGDLLAILAEQGVTDPNAGPWEVTLPNGVTIGARPAS